MNSNVTNLVTSLAQGKVSQAQESFARAMSEKMNAALDERKIAIASQVYSKPATPSK
jgi:hypothetical protein